jgi:hypothetical protein
MAFQVVRAADVWVGTEVGALGTRPNKPSFWRLSPGTPRSCSTLRFGNRTTLNMS